MCVMDVTDSRRAIAEVLTTKRKPRELKACYPCRQRKVKCNNETPCEGCVKREHPELCMMLGPSKKKRLGTPESKSFGSMGSMGSSSVGSIGDLPLGEGRVSASAVEALLAKVTAIEASISSLKTDLLRLRAAPSGTSSPQTSMTEPASSPPIGTSPSSTSSLLHPQQAVPYQPSINYNPPPAHKTSIPPGIHAPENVTGSTVYLGSNSEPAFLLAHPQHSGQLPKNVLQIFGLHNSNATYPFANLWPSSEPNIGIQDVCRTLPSGEEILRLFQRYRENAWPYYPAVVDVEAFESEVCDFVTERAEGGDAICGRSPSWLGLLFAVLASGIQFSEVPVGERELSSRVYVCCSMQCLRIANIFVHPTATQIQALLLLGNSIRNDTNPGAAWILLGLTIRLAQSIGIHRSSHEDGGQAEKSMKVWWAIVWQDSLLSFSFDRPLGATGPNCTAPFSSNCPTALDNPKTFTDAIYSLCRVIRDLTNAISHPEGGAPISIPALLHYKARLESILRCGTVPNINAPSTKQTRLESLALRIHVGYSIAQLCRFTLRHNASAMNTNGGPSPQAHFSSECIIRCQDVVIAFLDMIRLSAVVCRSWAFTHNALSCALLLRILAPDDERARELVQRMEATLENQERTGGKPYAVVLAALRGSEGIVGERKYGYENMRGMMNGMNGARQFMGEQVNGQEQVQGGVEAPFDVRSPASRILDDIIWGGGGTQFGQNANEFGF